jgi:hypothetical protein
MAPQGTIGKRSRSEKEGKGMTRPVHQDRFDYDRVAESDDVDVEGTGEEDLDCSWEDVYSSYGCSTGIEH